MCSPPTVRPTPWRAHSPQRCEADTSSTDPSTPSELGITLEQVDNAEAGRTPLRLLPEPISSRIPWLGIDLTALAADPAA